MTIRRRIERLEQPPGRPDDTVELLGFALTRAELSEWLRNLAGTTTQSLIDPEANAP